MSSNKSEEAQVLENKRKTNASKKHASKNRR